MSSHATARRAALLFLFLTMAAAGSLGPASAMLVGDPSRHDPPNPSSVPSESGPGLVLWLLVGIAAAAMATGVALLITRRQRRSHRAVLAS